MNSNTPNAPEVFDRVNKLIAAWCDRRLLKALRCILAGYPLVSGLTDEWAKLYDALKDVRVFCRDQITDDEMKEVIDLIHVVVRIVYRS